MINVNTPTRKRCIKRVARRKYKSLASMMFTRPDSTKSATVEMGCKILAEMQTLSSDAHDSFLRNTMDAVKTFNWEKVMSEYTQTVPTLIMLLECLVPKPAEKKPFICFVASLLLKCRHQRMALVQRAVSIMLYGNGCSKQVRIPCMQQFYVCVLDNVHMQLYNNLQPLNVCMSYQGTLNLVKKLCIDHDVKVQKWADEIKDNYLISPVYCTCTILWYGIDSVLLFLL